MKNWKRTIGLFVCFVMLIGLLRLGSVPVRAAGADGDEEETVGVNMYFGPDDEFPIGTQEVKKGELAVMPEDPYIEGKTFLGWYVDRDFSAKYDFSTPVTEDIDIFARFVDNSDLIKLNAYLSVDDEYPVATRLLIKGEIPVAPAEPWQEGRTFRGWYADKDFTTPFDFSAPLYEDTDIYAKFVSDDDMVAVNMYFGPDDDFPIGSQEFEKGGIPVKPDDPYIEGKTFMGWYVDREFSALFDFNAPVYEDVDIFARFVSDDDLVAVYFYFGPDDTIPIAGQEVEKGHLAVKPDDPYVEGTTFMGWYTDRDLTNLFDFSTPVTEDIELFAKFVDDTEIFAVYIYLSPDDTEPTAGQEVEKGHLAVRPADPAQEGKTFHGWYTDRECTQLFDFNTPITQDINLYAYFTVDAEESQPEESQPEESQPEESQPEESQPEESQPEESQPEESQPEESQPEESQPEESLPEEDNTVKLNTYLNVDDELPVATREFEKGSVPTEPAEPGMEGKTFRGWYTDKEFTTPFDFTAPLYEDTNIYAKFVDDEDMIAVYIYLNPDDTDPTAGQEVEKGQQAVKPEDPAREGMTFDGWHTDRECTILYDFKTPVMEETHLYAKWTVNYTVAEAPEEWAGEGGLDFVVKEKGDTDTSYDHFEGATMDGEPLDEANYTVEKGSLKLTLKEEYLKTLAPGEHVLGMIFAGDVSVETAFEVKEAEASSAAPVESSAESSKAESSEAEESGEESSEPTKGGGGNIGLWAAIAGGALVCLGGTAAFIIAKKKKKG